MSEKGTFIGVSIGPGQPGLLTLEAVKTILHTNVIAAPRTRKGEMLAFNIARNGISQFLNESFGFHVTEASEQTLWASKTLVPLDFPMPRNDPAATLASHQAVAEQIKPYLDAGQDVAMLNLGDVSVYATVHYIAELLEADGYKTNMQAGVTSFCASAAALNMSLTGGLETPILIIPGALNDEATERLIREPGTKILMKTIGVLPEIIALLKETGQAERTSAVVNCGLPNEQVYPTLAEFETALREVPKNAKSYFTTLIVKGEE